MILGDLAREGRLLRSRVARGCTALRHDTPALQVEIPATLLKVKGTFGIIYTSIIFLCR